jgi:AsmA protein
MIRSLTSGILSGWQETREETTDLTQLSMSFRVDKGQATTSDLNLVGPLVRVTGAGTVDLGARSLAFRVEPKLVMTTEGQGRTTDPVGLGIPVVIDGPWASPRIYPEIAGILDNPDAAYARLKEMGKGLFGSGTGDLGAPGDSGSAGGGDKDGGSTDQLGGRLGETLGNLLRQGLSRGHGTPAPAAPPADAADDPAPQPPQDNQPMNDMLRQLFNR